MATEVTRNLLPVRFVSSEESFMEQHFAKVAFAIAGVALFCLSPLTFFLGSVAGFIFHFSLEPKLKLNSGDKIVTIPHTVFAVVGAFAAVVQILPAGATGGVILKAIAPLCSMAFGSVGYSAFRKYI